MLAGEFTVVNRQLVEDLMELQLWNPMIVNKIIYNNGSVQNVEEIPQDIKNLYKACNAVSHQLDRVGNISKDPDQYGSRSWSFY